MGLTETLKRDSGQVKKKASKIIIVPKYKYQHHNKMQVKRFMTNKHVL